MTKRPPIVVLFLALFLCSTAVGTALPRDCAILPTSQGWALIRQCSRGSPANVSGFWEPSPAQVLTIEQRLPELLRKSGQESVLAGSRRQYIGVTSRGKKLIYLNAFPASALDVGEHTNWKTEAFTVCDGGDVFWGLEFDPADETFHNIQFNGVA
jgi:hypothetical protein